MSAISRWILRAPLRDVKKLNSLRSQIFTLAAWPGPIQELGEELFAISGAVDLSETPERPDTLVFLAVKEGDPRVAVLLGHLRTLTGVTLEPDRQLVSFSPVAEKRDYCGSLDIPPGNPGAAGIDVALIEDASVKGAPDWEVKRFAVSEHGVKALTGAPLGDPPHATEVAGFLVGNGHGAATGATVWSYRLATGRASEMLRALQHIRDETPVRVTCSAMGMAGSNPPSTIAALHDLIDALALRPRPIFFVACAGNDTKETIGSPGAAPEAITVGVHRGTGVNSSHGAEGSEKPTLVAHVDSDVATIDPGTCWPGTSSVTAPYVAGCIATWLHVRPGLKREELHHVLVTASKREDHQDRLYYGHGIVNLEHALKLVEKMNHDESSTPPRASYGEPSASMENVRSPRAPEAASSP